MRCFLENLPENCNVARGEVKSSASKTTRLNPSTLTYFHILFFTIQDVEFWNVLMHEDIND